MSNCMGDDTAKRSSQRGKWARRRAIVAAAVALALLLSLVLGRGIGSYSSAGLGALCIVCPLGFVQAALAGVMGYRAAAAALATVVAVLLVGKAFCSWVCPVPWFRRLFRTPSAPPRGNDPEPEDGKGCPPAATCASCNEKCSRWADGDAGRLRIDGRFGVLAGAIASSAVVGFPVFCLVCPVGLAFAFFLALSHALVQHELVLDLLAIPVILALEVLVFRKWCSGLCPISAMLSLLSARKRLLRPRVDESKCLHAKGIDCAACSLACAQQLNPCAGAGPDCTQCGACADACPAAAISLLPRLARAKGNEPQSDAADSAVVRSSSE